MNRSSRHQLRLERLEFRRMLAPVYFEGTGHYYDFVPGEFSWDQARAHARTLEHMGLAGQVATLSTAEEDAFVRTTFAAQTDEFKGPRIGASWNGRGRGPTEGYSWVTGDEFSFTNWNRGEPTQGPENTIHFSRGGWNDIAEDRTDTNGYLVEFQSQSTDLIVKGASLSARGVEFSYAMSGFRLQSDTDAAIYWASGENESDILALAADAVTIPTSTPLGVTVVSNFAAASFVPRPPGATHLLILLDAAKSVDEGPNEANNIYSISLSGVVLQNAFSLPANVEFSQSSPGVLSNYLLSDSDQLEVTLQTGPENGTLELSSDGAFRYRPNPAFQGVDRFTYEVTDALGSSTLATTQLRVGNYASVISADRPLGYWRLNEASAGNPAVDESGNGFHGDINQVVVLAEPGGIVSEVNTAATFEDDAHIEIGRQAALSRLRNDFSIEAWIRPTALSGPQRIFTNTESNGRPGFGFGTHNESLIFTTFGILDYVTRPVLEAGNWYHVAVNFDSSNNATFFLNGKELETIEGSSPPRRSDSSAHIGGLSRRENFRGTIDEVAVYDRQLSLDSVLNHYMMGIVDSGKAPATSDDTYYVQSGAEFEVTVPSVPTPRYSFTDDFSNSTLNPNLEDPTSSFQIGDGVLTPRVKRQYIRTRKADYMSGDFVFEVDIDLRTTNSTIEFVGIGPGDQGPVDEPADALYLRLHSVGYEGGVDMSANGPFGGTVFGRIEHPGIHRVRLTKTGNQMLVEVDAYREGVFEADMSHQIRDVQKLAPFLNDRNSRLILGGSAESSFDNLVVISSLDEDETPGLLQNDTYGIGLPTTAALAAGPQHGSLSLRPDGTFAYTPNEGHFGIDTFTYYLDDGHNWSNLSTVTLHINGPPVSVADSYVLAEDTVLSVELPGIEIAQTGFNDQTGILGNDTLNSPYRLNENVADQGISESGWTAGWETEGNVSHVVSDKSYEGDGALHLVPTSNARRAWDQIQEDQFTIEQHLRFTDGSRTTIHILGGNGLCCDRSTGPVLGVFSDQTINVLQDQTWVNTEATWEPDRWYKVSTVIDVKRQTWKLLIDDMQVLDDTTFTFAGGPTSFNAIAYRAGPSGDGVFVDKIRILDHNQIAGVLSNDLDPNGNKIVARLAETTSHGHLTLRTDGTFEYVPAPHFSGIDSFTYQAFDQFGSSGITTVTLIIEPTNDAPTANDDEYILGFDRKVNASIDSGVLFNDSDIDGDSLTAVLVDAPTHGQLQLNGDGSFVYDAKVAAAVDQFTYYTTDGELSSNTRTVTIVSHPPTVHVGSVSLLPNLPNQQIPVFVSGGHLVSGLDLFAMIGDGGPERESLGLDAGSDGPTITAVDLKADTIFSTVPDTARDIGSLPQIANWTLSLSDGGTVVADGLLATITIDTTGFIDGTWDFQLTNVLPEHPSGPFDSTFADWSINVVNGSLTIEPATVAGRHVFYNNSSWDGDAAAANANDDVAIATDKIPLLPGETGSFANYTSYSKGINGLMVDIANHPAPDAIRLSDFEFRVGRNSDVSLWQQAPNPEMTVRTLDEGDRSVRVTFTWPDNEIQQEWLEVRVKSNTNTLLAGDDVFYFGNAIGETGNSRSDSLVTSVDVIGARDHQRGPFDAAAITDPYDFNRDQIVSSVDVILARDNQVGFLTALPLITPQVTPVQLAAVAAARVGENADTTDSACRVDADERMMADPENGRLLPTQHSTIGDSNHDGIFDSSDLVLVFQSGEYEDSIDGNSSWSEGDWDCSGDFDSTDLILAFQQGGFERPVPAHAASQSAITAVAMDMTRNTQKQQSHRHPTASTLTNGAGQARRIDSNAVDAVFYLASKPTDDDRTASAFVS